MTTLSQHLQESLQHPPPSDGLCHQNFSKRSLSGTLQIGLSQLKPHPRNSSIYGEEEDVTELVELIRRSGWVNPLVITQHNVIISGHRRWRAVQILGWEIVPVEVREFPNELAALEALLLENASREKMIEQKVREGRAWEDIEKEKARIRQLELARTRPNTKPDLQENFPEGHKGQSRDRVAQRVGLGSGRTYEKAAKVVSVIDEETRLGNFDSAKGLRKVLNFQSVDAATKLLKKPPQKRIQILSKIASGEALNTKQAEKLVIQQQLNGNCFSVHELSLVAKAPQQNCPYRLGDIVVVEIDRREAATSQEKKWNGFWGLIESIGEMGSIRVNVGNSILQLFPRDLKPIDAPSTELVDVAQRVLQLRSEQLDELEEKMLDVLQQRFWFTAHQLIHLENIEKLYPQTNNSRSDIE